MIKIKLATTEELVAIAKNNFDIFDGCAPADEYGASLWAGNNGGSFMRILITEGGKFLCCSPDGMYSLYNKNGEYIAYLPNIESEDDLITDESGFVIAVAEKDCTDEDEEIDVADNSEAVNFENQGIANEQATVNMTEQVENELTVLEAAEQYAAELREAESNGHVEQSEEDLLMKLNYDEYTMKMITKARRKQLAS